MSSSLRSCSCGFRVKRRHLARIQQTLGAVPLLGQELDVVRALASAAFDIVTWEFATNANLTAEINQCIQTLFADETNHRNRAWDHLARAIFHELQMGKNLVAKMFLQLPELVARAGRIESELDAGIFLICFHRPQRRVIPGVIGKQRAGAQAGELLAGKGGLEDASPGTSRRPPTRG
jgi:hypothetical protein